jgi:hypothetical protein
MKVFEGMQRELGFFDDQKFRVPRRGRILPSSLFLPASTNLCWSKSIPQRPRLVKLGLSVEQVAAALGFSVEEVRRFVQE